MRAPSRLCLLILFVSLYSLPAGTFHVVSYNLESYLDQALQTRPAKSANAKAKIRESIRALKPDVLALQEMGTASALRELQVTLKDEGLDLPFSERVGGADTNIHIAILSRFPLIACRPHTNDTFLLSGRRFRVSRGIAEVDICVNDHYAFTLFSAHLKSKRPSFAADEAELRLEEAKVLREKLDARLATDPKANLVVLGDLNDTQDSVSTKTVIGRGKGRLVDTRPAEQNGDAVCSKEAGLQRDITWTHFFAKEDTYSRIDYILLSSGMAKEWITNQTAVLAIPGWGLASDHRPIVATFEDVDK